MAWVTGVVWTYPGDHVGLLAKEAILSQVCLWLGWELLLDPGLIWLLLLDSASWPRYFSLCPIESLCMQ